MFKSFLKYRRTLLYSVRYFFENEISIFIIVYSSNNTIKFKNYFIFLIRRKINPRILSKKSIINFINFSTWTISFFVVFVNVFYCFSKNSSSSIVKLYKFIYLSRFFLFKFFKYNKESSKFAKSIIKDISIIVIKNNIFDATWFLYIFLIFFL